MKLLLGTGLAILLLASLPARADTTSDLAQCEKTVKMKSGDISGDNVAPCMINLGYALDRSKFVDELTSCNNLYSPGIEARCYHKDGAREIGRVPAPLPADWRGRKIDELLAQEAAFGDKCRSGGPSHFYTEDVCNQRARAEMVLTARGWCRQAQAGKDDTDANKIWQPCRKEAP